MLKGDQSRTVLGESDNIWKKPTQIKENPHRAQRLVMEGPGKPARVNAPDTWAFADCTMGALLREPGFNAAVLA